MLTSDGPGAPGSCVGCKPRYLACPADGAITMLTQARSGGVVTWQHHSNNPLHKEQMA
jgi:Fe-S-cluster-containing hydrogenase component 2